jgi:chromosome segregation ATPase
MQELLNDPTFVRGIIIVHVLVTLYLTVQAYGSTRIRMSEHQALLAKETEELNKTIFSLEQQLDNRVTDYAGMAAELGTLRNRVADLEGQLLAVDTTLLDVPGSTPENNLRLLHNLVGIRNGRLS